MVQCCLRGWHKAIADYFHVQVEPYLCDEFDPICPFLRSTMRHATRLSRCVLKLKVKHHLIEPFSSFTAHWVTLKGFSTRKAA